MLSSKKKDVVAEIEYWQIAVLCSVVGANPPFEIILGLIKRIWATFDIDKIITKGSISGLIWEYARQIDSGKAWHLFLCC